MSLVRRGRRAPRTMLRLLVLAVLPALVSCVTNEDEENNMCTQHYCTCHDTEHPSWITINCTLNTVQEMHLFDGHIPLEATELVMEGAQALYLEAGALSQLMDLRRVRISGARLVVFRRSVAVNLNIINAYIEIENCNELRFEEKAFSNIRGPLSVSIKNCRSVTVEGEAFSWLLKLSISGVQSLVLRPGAFALDPTAANVGEHGPGMSIDLRDLTAPEIPAQAFGSSAAEVTLHAVQVRAIRPGAFSANTYNVVTITDSSINVIESGAFAQRSLINNLLFRGCKIYHFRTNALQSAITKLDISRTRFDIIETGAINATIANVRVEDSEFHRFYSRGFEFTSWNSLYMAKNKFDTLPPNAFVAKPTIVNQLTFIDNEIEYIFKDSLEFIGKTYRSRYFMNARYRDNYYGARCNCQSGEWLAEALGFKSAEPFMADSFCTVDEFFAKCFNVPDQNIRIQTFIDKVCSEKTTVECEKYQKKSDVPTEIKNPRFPHKSDEDSLSDRNKKVIGIIIVTALGCIIIVMFASLIRWMKRRGYCASIKNTLLATNSSCGAMCGRLCVCGRNNGLDNTRSISQLSVHEYSERRRLNEPRLQENAIMETTLLAGPEGTVEDTTPMDDKATQTLPEELTKELLENLKEKLEDPENYVEAREMIEHLYELIKVEESCNANSPNVLKMEENIYELPFQNTTPRIGKNKKQMISIGTRTPSLDKLLPLSPYNRQTALAHEYFEPKDFAVHLYAEIANCDKEKRTLLGTIPDIVEQVVPRGPYLRAVREKKSSPSFSPSSKSLNSSTKSPVVSPTASHLMSPIQSPSIKSNKSTASNSSGKMMNRPLPEKPTGLDPGEGTSSVVG